MKRLLTGVLLGAVAVASFQVLAGTLTTAVPPVPGFSTGGEGKLVADFKRNAVSVEVLNGTDEVGVLIVRKRGGAVSCDLVGPLSATITPDCSGIAAAAFDNWMDARKTNAATILSLAGVYQ